MPTDVEQIRREHVDRFIERLVSTRAPTTANDRYRALTALFNFVLDFGEISDSPMRKGKPPKVPEVPVPVLTDDQLWADGYRGYSIVDRAAGYPGGHRACSHPPFPPQLCPQMAR
jgi:hypothetical protein